MKYADFFEELDQAVSETTAKPESEVSHLTWSDWHHFTEVMSELTSNIQIVTLLEKVMDHAMELTHAERGFIVLLNEKQEKEVLVARGVDRTLFEDAMSATSSTVIRRLFELKQPLLIERISDDSIARQRSIIKMGICSILGAPLISRGKIIGVAYVDTSIVANAFSPREQDLFSALASITTIAIENSRLFSSLESALKSLQNTTDYLENLLRSLPLGVIVFASNRMVYFANAIAKNTLWGDPDAPLPRDASEAPFFQTNSGKNLFLYVNKDSRADLPIEGSEEVNGKIIQYLVFSIPWSDSLNFCGLILVDRTSQHKLELEILKFNKYSILSQVAGSIAHEINNALTPVLSSVDMIRMLREKERGTNTGHDAQQEYIDIAESQLQRTTQIVQNLRDLSKPKQPVMERVDLVSVIESTVNLFHKSSGRLPKFFEKLDDNFHFVFTKPTYSIYVLGDPDHLEGMFYNILINAAYAVEEKGTGDVSLTMSKTGKSAVVVIEDQGIGIPQSKLKQIFDPYYSTKPSNIGTGLGMTIVDMVATAHKAKLDIQSEVGVGTKITLTFHAIE